MRFARRHEARGAGLPAPVPVGVSAGGGREIVALIRARAAVGRPRLGLAIVWSAALHAALVLAAWRAGLLRGAARDDPPRELVEISLAPALAALAPEAMAEPSGARRRTVAVKHAARGRNAGARLPSQPSEATGSPAAADAPLDLTGTPLVVATTGAHAAASGERPGGTRGIGPGPTDGRGARSATPAGAGDRSGAVSLQQHEWACPWPHDADDQQIDEQTVVIEVVVGPDGRAESATLLSDPGHGFGQAAVACALRTRFTPARDRQGQPTRATSPAVLVRFTR